MSNCVNHNHPDVIKLANEAGIHPASAASKIAIWQEQNNTTSFPSSLLSVKPGVAELFESTPELANAVYRDLGFFESKKQTSRITNEALYDVLKNKNAYNIDSLEYLLNNINDNFSLRLLRLFEGDKKFYINNSISEFGLYNAEDNSIHINTEKHIKNNPNGYNILETIVHELTHRFISLNILGLSQHNNEAKNIVDLFNDFKKIYKGNNKYALSNVDEFVSELLSNKVFQKELKEIPYKNSNIFNKFIDYLLSALNIKRDNLLSEAIVRIIEFKRLDTNFFNKFNNNIEIITPQQKQQAQEIYSQYLDSVFPDSKVKDIVYHGTDGKFDKFSKDIKKVLEREISNTANAYFFTNDLNRIKDYGNNKVNALINSREILSFKNISNDRARVLSDITYEKAKGYTDKNIDSIVADYDFYKDYIVFEPEQIHILGSKQDIEGFEEFVDKNKSKSFSQKISDFFNGLFENKNFLNFVTDMSNSGRVLLRKKELIESVHKFGNVYTNEILNLLKEGLPNNLTVKFSKTPLEKGEGFYNNSTKQIVVYLGTDNLEQVLLHELVHAATINLLDVFEQSPEKLTKAQLDSINKLSEIYIKALDIQKQKNLDYVPYWTTNLKEFVAEVFVNKELFDLLNNNFEKENLVSRFIKQVVNLIFNLTGINVNTKSMLESTLNELMFVVSENNKILPRYDSVEESINYKVNNENYTTEVKEKSKEFRDIISKYEDYKVEGEEYTDGTNFFKRITNLVEKFIKGEKPIAYEEYKAAQLWDENGYSEDSVLTVDVGGIFFDLNKQEYIDKLRENRLNAAIKGDYIHSVLQLIFNPDQASEIEENVKELLLKGGSRMSLKNRYTFIKEELPAILSSLNINFSLSNDNKITLLEEARSEVKVMSDILGFGGTIDLLVKKADNLYQIVDWKTGKNLDNPFTTKLLQFGRTYNITDTGLNKAKIQILLYAIALKSQNPSMKFKDLKVANLSSRFTATSHNPEMSIDVREFLPMIEGFFNQPQYKEIKEKLLEADSNIFNASHYTVYGNEINDIAKDLDIDPASYLESLENKLSAFIAYKKFYGFTKEDDEYISEMFKKIAEYKAKANFNFSSTKDIGGFSSYFSNMNDVNNDYITFIKQELDKTKDEIDETVRFKMKKFRLLLDALKEERKQNGLLKKTALDKLSGTFDKTSFYDFMYLEVNDKGIRTDKLVTESLFTQKNSDLISKRGFGLTELEKKILNYVHNEIESFFVDKEGKTAIFNKIGEGNSRKTTKGKSRIALENTLRSEAFKYEEGFFPKIPITEEEVRENSPIISKEKIQFWFKSKLTTYFETAFDLFNQQSTFLRIKYLGNSRINSSKEYSKNMEEILEKFYLNAYQVDKLNKVYSLSQAAIRTMETKKDNFTGKGLYEHSVKYLDIMNKFHILGERQEIKISRIPIYAPLMDRNGNHNEAYISITKIIKGFGKATSWALMWLKLIPGLKNAALISTVTGLERFKGTLYKTLKKEGYDEEEIDMIMSVEAFKKSHGEYLKFIKDAMIGGNSLRANKFRLMLEEFRFIPSFRDFDIDPNQKVGGKNRLYDEGNLYMFHKVPEEYISMMILGQYMMQRKNKKTGKSLYDSYEVEEIEVEGLDNIVRKEYKLKWNGGSRGTIIKPNGEKEELFGLDSLEKEKIRRVYQRIHGGYRKSEATPLDYLVLGSVFIQFRKYVPSILMNLFQSSRFDQSLGYYKTIQEVDAEGNTNAYLQWTPKEIEGRYRLLWNSFMQFVHLKEGEEYKFKNLSPDKQQQMIGIVLNFVLIVASLVAFASLGWDDEEDEKDTLKKAVRAVTNNVFQQYNAVELFKTIAASPASITTTIDAFSAYSDLMGAMYNLSPLPFATEEKAYNTRGDLVGLKRALAKTPLFSSMYDFHKFTTGTENEMIRNLREQSLLYRLTLSETNKLNQNPRGN